MASNKVTLSVPVVRNGETIRHREVQVSKALADAQLKKPVEKRHRIWKGAKLVSKSEPKATKTETK